MRHRTIFISDVHLGTPGCQAEILLDFLSNNHADTIYLVGDIIDAWRLRWAGTALSLGATISNRPAASETTSFVLRGKRLFDDYREQQSALRDAVDAQITADERTQSRLMRVVFALEAAMLAIALLLVQRQRRGLQDLVVRPVASLLATISRLRQGDLSLADVDPAHPAAYAATLEKVIRKLRAGLMPPARRPRRNRKAPTMARGRSHISPHLA